MLGSPENPIFRDFLAQICPKYYFFENRALSEIKYYHILYRYAKNKKKIPSQSREMLIFPKYGRREFPQIRNSDFYGQKHITGKNGLSHFLESIFVQKIRKKQFHTKSKKKHF